MPIKVIHTTVAQELHNKNFSTEKIMELRKETIELAKKLEGLRFKSEEEFKNKLKETYGMRIYNVKPGNFTALLNTLGLTKITGINNRIKETVSVTTKHGHRTDIDIVIEM